MKIIITETFRKDCKNFFWKEFKVCSIEKIIGIINKEILIHWMYVSRPFMKIKFNFCNKSIRMVVLKDKDIWAIIPVFITDKNDKVYWYNLIWNNISKKVLVNMEKITKDILNKKYSIY